MCAPMGCTGILDTHQQCESPGRPCVHLRIIPAFQTLRKRMWESRTPMCAFMGCAGILDTHEQCGNPECPRCTHAHPRLPHQLMGGLGHLFMGGFRWFGHHDVGVQMPILWHTWASRTPISLIQYRVFRILTCLISDVGVQDAHVCIYKWSKHCSYSWESKASMDASMGGTGVPGTHK